MVTSRFDAFVVYKPVTCSAFGMGDPEELFDRAEVVLDATISAGVETALAAGDRSEPVFGDTNVDILNSGTAVSAKVGQSFLEEYLGTECRQGMLHFTPAILSSLQAWPVNGSEGIGAACRERTPIVSGMGYQGVDTAALSTPAAKQDWAFATGPVKGVFGADRVDASRRTSIVRSTCSRSGRNGTCSLSGTPPQGAALIDWST